MSLLLPFLTLAPRAGEAQTHVSLSAGRISSTLEGDDARMPFGEGLGEGVDLGNEVGFFAGASLRLPLGGTLSVSPGLYLVQKGTTFVRDLQAGYVELSYLEVPVTLSLEATDVAGPFGVRVFAGPEIGFEIHCDLETRGFSIGLPYNQFEDCTSSPEDDESGRKRVAFGITFGGEVSYGRFFLNGGLDVGLTSLDDSDSNEDFRNSAWFLGAGILIGR